MKRPFGVLAAVVAVAVFFVPQVAAGVVVGIAAGVSGRGATPDPLVLMLAMFLAFVATIAAVPWFVEVWTDRPWRSRLGRKILGLAPAPRRLIVFGAGSGIANALVLYALATIWPPPPEFEAGPIAKMLEDSAAARIVFALLAVLLAPVAEEITFRGAVYAGLRKRLRPLGAAAVISVFFLVIHFSEIWGYGPAILAIGMLSVGTMAWRMTTGSALPAIAMHFTYNLAVVLPSF